MPGSHVNRVTRLVVAASLVMLSACATSLDQEHLEGQIQEWAEDLNEDLMGEPVTINVDCPDDARAESGYTFICELSDGVDTLTVRVTVLNENGDVEWQLLG